MSKKNIIFIIIAVVLIIIGIIFLNNRSVDNKSNSGTQQGTVVDQPKTSEVKTNGTYQMYNTSITTDTGSTIIKGTIKNISNSDTPKQSVSIVLLDKNNNEINTFKATVAALKSGEATTVYVESLKVYDNIYDFRIE